MAGKLRARLTRSEALTDQPDFALVGVLRIPQLQTSPARAIYKRVLIALGALAAAVLIVYIDRAGYRDAQDN